MAAAADNNSNIANKGKDRISAGTSQVSVDSSGSRYIVGIDLGTTHTVVSFVDTASDHAIPETDNESLPVEIFPIDQLVAPGEMAARPLLPSFRYHPVLDEIPPESMSLPWGSTPFAGELSQVVIGSWAQQLGASVAGRLVASAKSWLSHAQVDRHASILPWGAEPDVDKVSPVVASASYLNYVRQAWNYRHPQALLEHQQVVITIPASFDESARALTVQAAQLSGLIDFVLLEEPQAVVYDWYARHIDGAAERLAEVNLLLVCDIGGGTTDLSLIKVGIEEDQLSFVRVGVGDHLMLGGDNIDLALAHQAEMALGMGGKNLSTSRLAQLIQQCRQAKELLLAENAPESATVTLVGAGSKLIGGAKKYTLLKQDVHELVLNGFFPLCELDDLPAKRKSAIVEFGLPYVSDPAVSKHLAEFLCRHQQATMETESTTAGAHDGKTVSKTGTTPAASSQQASGLPEAVLFNGGAFNSPLITARVEALLNQWHVEYGLPIKVLDNPHGDLAVARGATAYGIARRYNRLKIGGGSARSFFLVLEDQPDQGRGVCVLPRGSEENQQIELAEHCFELRLGQPVKFNLATTAAERSYEPGEICQLDNDFLMLPPLLAVLDRQHEDSGEHQPATQHDRHKAGQDRAEVKLVASLTEVGTIELYCCKTEHDKASAVSGSTPERWKLEFEIRKSTPTLRQTSIELPAGFAQAIEKIDEVFGAKRKEFNPQAIKTLRNDLIKILGKREEWPTHLLRELFNALLERKKNRTRSEAHERVWFNLTGFCLRPGFGDPLDSWRVEQVWPMYQQGLQFNQGNQSWSEWWVFWRRIAGGLNTQQQLKIYKDLAKYINPSATRNRKLVAELKQRSYEDMLRTIASLEHIPLEQKTEVAGWLLKRLDKKSESPTAWWALGRLASRFPFHGSVHNLIAKEKVQKWIERILAENWKKNHSAAFAAVMMSRKTGDRERDLDETLVGKVIAQLQAAKLPGSWTSMLSEVRELDEADTSRVFGEALPQGLKLIDNVQSH